MAFMRKYRELLLGVAMLLVAVVYLAATTRIEIRIQTTFNARFVPYILGVLTALLGVLQCWNFHRNRNRPEHAPEQSDPRAVVLTFLFIIAYVWTLRTVGFLINTTWLMFFMMLLLCPRKQWKPLQFILISAATTVVIYYAFRNGLQLMLPDGIFG